MIRRPSPSPSATTMTSTTSPSVITCSTATITTTSLATQALASMTVLTPTPSPLIDKVGHPQQPYRIDTSTPALASMPFLFFQFFIFYFFLYQLFPITLAAKSSPLPAFPGSDDHLPHLATTIPASPRDGDYP